MTLAALCEAHTSLTLVGEPLTPITGIACNTKLGDVRPGVLFAPLDLRAAQIAPVAAAAVAQGATALLVERRLDAAVPQLIASETRTALPRVSAAFYGFPAHHVPSIGVTGTDGKTTTAFLIDAILQSAGIPSGLISSAAARFGPKLLYQAALSTHSTPEAPTVQRWLRRMVDDGARWAVLEATSHGLALHRLDEVRFSVAAITFISQDHLGFHKSVAAYKRAKAILFERVAETGGVAVINVDDPAAREMVAYVGSAQVITYSAAGRDADVRAAGLALGKDGTRFELATPAGAARVMMPLLGDFNVPNALCAAAVALAIDVPLVDIVRGLGQAAPVPGLLARIDAGQPFTVLIDEAKSPLHLVMALEVAQLLAAGNRIIALVGGTDWMGAGMLRHLGQVAALAADYAVFTGQDPGLEDPAALAAQIAVGARAAGGRRGKTFTCVADREQAIRHALEVARPGDCVVLIGKGAEEVRRVGGETVPWDEAAIAQEVLAELGYRGYYPEPAAG
jgi:UDP-N-acetylmuramoyl-L-alanyl-D-glutamate--2,6-diaminopimelate ligase